MNDWEHDHIEIQPAWRLVLSAYRDVFDAERKQLGEHEGWLTRLNEIDGVADEDLSAVHGSLIALGFLKFRLAGRTSGMQYQLSSFAARMLNREHTDTDDEPTDVALSA